MDNRTFFVVSSGRSGSKTVADALNRCEGCRCLHHPEPELVLAATEYFYGNYDGDEIARTLRATRPMGGSNGEVYGEANLQMSLMIPLLRETFPECRLVWLLRDGRNAVASMYYRGWYDPFNFPKLGIWHMARLQGDRTGDFTREEWAGMSRFAKCCWIWKKYNEIIETELRGLDASAWRQVRIESLKADLVELTSVLGLPPSSEPVRVERMNRRKQAVVEWQDWPEDHRTEFESLCGRAMDRWYAGWRDASGTWLEIEAEAPDAPPKPSIKGRVKNRLHNVLMTLDSFVQE